MDCRVSSLLRHCFLCLITWSGVSVAGFAQDSPPPRWWKGNLHTHSLWSDGDQFPEMIADWYRRHGYNFLALTDHNVLSEGDRWMSLSEIVGRSDSGILRRYQERFGDAWVQTRGDASSDAIEVRLKPLNEFRYLLEEKEKFILIPGEEISDRAEGKPVHINATNLVEPLSPTGGRTIRETMQNNLRAILEHGRTHGLEVLPHLNHPNFHYAISAEDLAAVVSERFYEVYNGHPSVNHLGDASHPGVERLWDLVNAIRQTKVDVPPLMGIATDDSHEYHGEKGSRPGRGWVMVRSRYLTPEHLIMAMKRGDFYASSGVLLRDVRFDDQSRTLSVETEASDDTNYRIDFVATLRRPLAETNRSGKGLSEQERIGQIVATVHGTTAAYKLDGSELYVRAVVTSSKEHPDPSFEGQRQQAWTQPVGWQNRVR